MFEITPGKIENLMRAFSNFSPVWFVTLAVVVVNESEFSSTKSIRKFSP